MTDVSFDAARVREDFPVLARRVRDGKPLVYLDSGATSQSPEAVITAEGDFYRTVNAAVHRGAHQLSEAATDAYEAARATISGFIGGEADEIVFTKNATEALNLVAYAFSNAGFDGALDGVDPELAERLRIGPGDEIVITPMEHHANLVPWQELARRTGATLRWCEITDDGRIDLDSMRATVGEKTKIVAFSHVSNVLGTINPVDEISAIAREVGAWVVLDACQSVPHMPVDVRELDVDFLAFSGHKMLGPTGIGALVATEELLAAMPPVLTGGSMIEVVTMESSTFMSGPPRFEAGSQPLAQAAGWRAAVEYLAEIGLDRLHATEQVLTRQVLEGLTQVPGLRLVGPTDTTDRLGVVAFSIEGVHPHDVGQVLDAAGVAVRTGHHCAQPIHQHFGIHASSRLSFGACSTPEEVNRFLSAIADVRRYFQR